MDSFWEFLWYMIVVFAFMAYLILFFHILSDLFGDRTVSGVAKALWVIVLILVPFFSALIYLMVRGQGMEIRARRARIEAKEAGDRYIRQVAGKSAAEQISDAKALQDSGAISAAEFEELKARALRQSSAGSSEAPIR